MPKVKIYNQQGEITGEQELKPEIFEVAVNDDLVHQAVVYQQANSRQTLAHVKDRSEVRGGGRKPWRQKGTGRARHGSIRSPIWRGGGATFGPSKAKNYSKKMNKRMRQRALLMCLSDKVANEKLIIMDKLEIPERKTKLMVQILDKLPSKNRKTLIALKQKDDKLIDSVKNLTKIKTLPANSLNVVDILSNDYLIVPQAALEQVEKLAV